MLNFLFKILKQKRKETKRKIININFHQLSSDKPIYNFIKPDGKHKKPYIIFFNSVVHEIYSYTHIEKIMNPLEKEMIRKKS